MKKEHFAQAVDRLKEVNSVIEGLDERIRAEAFEILKPYVVSDLPVQSPPPPPPGGGSDGTSRSGSSASGGGSGNGVGIDARMFLGEHQGDKPSDNVYAIAAWWYSRHGLAPLDRRTVEDIANSEGVMIPKRPDSTLDKGTYEGKKKYTRKGGGYVPTITGEKWIREVYGVSKGTSTPPAPDES